MITSKARLLAGTIILMIQVVWTPALWSMTELSGLHWWVIRLPLILSMPIGVGLFLSAIKDRHPHGRDASSVPAATDPPHTSPKPGKPSPASSSIPVID